jgi:hypothetical protein
MRRPRTPYSNGRLVEHRVRQDRSFSVVIAFAVSLPMLIVSLFLLACVEDLLLWFGKRGIIPWKREATARAISARGFDVLHAVVDPGKGHELKERRTSLSYRDDEQNGAPPTSVINLATGTATIRLSQPPN